jgi:phosphotriesterase-related protein
VHAQNASNAYIARAAKQGAWLSFDGLRPETLDRHLELCIIMRDLNHLDRVLISHDAGWYAPDKPDGGTFRDFQVMFTVFFPMLKKAGFTDTEIDQIVTKNPARAFTVQTRLLAGQ